MENLSLNEDYKEMDPCIREALTRRVSSSLKLEALNRLEKLKSLTEANSTICVSKKESKKKRLESAINKIINNDISSTKNIDLELNENKAIKEEDNIDDSNNRRNSRNSYKSNISKTSKASKTSYSCDGSENSKSTDKDTDNNNNIIDVNDKNSNKINNIGKNYFNSPIKRRNKGRNANINNSSLKKKRRTGFIINPEEITEIRLNKIDNELNSLLSHKRANI